MVYVEEVDYNMVSSNRGSIAVSNGVVATNNGLVTESCGFVDVGSNSVESLSWDPSHMVFWGI